MIVRERPSGLRLFLVLRGSVLQRIRLTLLLNILLATLVTVMHGNLFSLKITLTARQGDGLDAKSLGQFTVSSTWAISRNIAQ